MDARFTARFTQMDDRFTQMELHHSIERFNDTQRTANSRAVGTVHLQKLLCECKRSIYYNTLPPDEIFPLTPQQVHNWTLHQPFEELQEFYGVDFANDQSIAERRKALLNFLGIYY